MTKVQRILVTGGSGQLGRELVRLRWPDNVSLVVPPRSELDLTQTDLVASYVLEGSFSAVINCGAYTAVDKAETDVLTAWQVNALSPAALATSSKVVDIPILHISTDYVFNGMKHAPYVETDPVAPLNVYGASKEAGEQAIRTGNARHIILRSAWIFGAFGKNFVKTMIELAKTRSEVRVVDDQRGCPTAAPDLAATIRLIALKMLKEQSIEYGTYHFTNEGSATWHEVAAELFRLLETRDIVMPRLVAIRSSDYTTDARRPENSILGIEKIGKAFDIHPRAWKSALADVSEAILERKDMS